MDSHLQPDDSIRISYSPRRSPQITQGLTSPVRSIHAMQMESLHSQPDMALRTADFFDDSSEDGRADNISPTEVAPDADLLEGRVTTREKKRRTASTNELFAPQDDGRNERLDPDQQGYQPLIEDEGQQNHHRMADTASSSFNGSVDELLPNGRHRSSPPELHSPRAGNERTPRTSAHIKRTPESRHISMPAPKVHPTLGAYAIAHEITLNALMRDENALDRSLQSFALSPLQTSDRNSMLPPALDPRSPRHRNFSSPATATTKKSVQLIPPPIDTNAPRRSIPDDIVRTPYPFTSEHVKWKDFSQLSPPSAAASTSASTVESILTISIRRSNVNRKLRITSLTVPASNDFTAVRSSSMGAKERHFKALDFDDQEFFLQLRRCYRNLSGPLRFLSARSLTRIAVSGPATKAADVGYGWRSPRLLAYKGLSDTFSEEQILRHYRNPALGHSRYAFVHWAHRLASIPPSRTPRPEEENQESERKNSLSGKQQPEGLELIVAWSVLRISTVLLLILAVSVAAALLWTFLGRNTAGVWPPAGGFRDAGDRVATGVLIGMCVLLLGLSSLAGWLGVSWLLM